MNDNFDNLFSELNGMASFSNFGVVKNDPFTELQEAIEAQQDALLHLRNSLQAYVLHMENLVNDLKEQAYGEV